MSLFHAVRNLDYFSDGDRSPETVMRTGRGACTAKHLLLRDLLRRCGEIADVELVEGDFAAGIPDAMAMPGSLRAWAQSGGAHDFHCCTIWRGPEGDLVLDATWPDRLREFGFPVNSEWRGEGDTQLAIAPRGARERAEDVASRKEQLLARLTAEEIAARRAFLASLSEWLATLRPTGP